MKHTMPGNPITGAFKKHTIKQISIKTFFNLHLNYMEDKCLRSLQKNKQTANIAK